MTRASTATQPCGPQMRGFASSASRCSPRSCALPPAPGVCPPVSQARVGSDQIPIGLQSSAPLSQDSVREETRCGSPISAMPRSGQGDPHTQGLALSTCRSAMPLGPATIWPSRDSSTALTWPPAGVGPGFCAPIIERRVEQAVNMQVTDPASTPQGSRLTLERLEAAACGSHIVQLGPRAGLELVVLVNRHRRDTRRGIRSIQGRQSRSTGTIWILSSLVYDRVPV
jgi:hypothetical protein